MIEQLSLKWDQLDKLYQDHGETPELLFQMYECADELIAGCIRQGKLTEAKTRAEEATSIGGEIVRMFAPEEFSNEQNMSFGPHRDLPFSSGPYAHRPIDIARRLVFLECLCATQHIADDDIGDPLNGHVYRAREHALKVVQENSEYARAIQREFNDNSELLRELFQHPATKDHALELLEGDLTKLKLEEGFSEEPGSENDGPDEQFDNKDKVDDAV
jgi:hypothetical protein